MGIVGTNVTNRNNFEKCGRQSKRLPIKGYSRQEIHVFEDEDEDEEELPAKVKYSKIAQEESYLPDDDFFSDQIAK